MRATLHRTNAVVNEKITFEQRRGYFSHLTLETKMLAADNAHAELEELLHYNACIQEEMRRIFTYRHETILQDLKTFNSYPTKPLRLLVGGSHGFIGSRLVCFLKALGSEVLTLPRDFSHFPLEGFDAVIHLAGENISSGLWTKKKKKKILESRVETTRKLAERLASCREPPRVFISPSAVGYYGDRPGEILTEDCAPGSGFLAEVCHKWERAADCLQERGVRLVHPRLGVVLSSAGGMLKKILWTYQWGLGAVLASGKQEVSWVSLDDVLYGIYHMLFIETLSGPVNLTSPYPLTQEEFAVTLARALEKKVSFRLPAWLLKLQFGQMAEELLLFSQQASAHKLRESGFVFRYPTLVETLRRSGLS